MLHLLRCRHGKFESVGSLFLSLTLLATGLSVGAWSYDKMHEVLVAQQFATVNDLDILFDFLLLPAFIRIIDADSLYCTVQHDDSRRSAEQSPVGDFCTSFFFFNALLLVLIFFLRMLIL